LSGDPLAAYEYDLPPECIAQRPPALRRDAKLLQWQRDGEFRDLTISDIGELTRPGDLLVLNDTRVLPARLLGRLAGGSEAELLLVRPSRSQPKTWWALARPGKKLVEDVELRFAQGVRVRIVEQGESGLRRVEAVGESSLEELSEREGHVPLPPYIRRGDDEQDRERYQTVFANTKGSVAAPTAGLHLDIPLLEELQARNVDVAKLTLHVGLDTFRPIRAEQLSANRLHGEAIVVSKELIDRLRVTREQGGRVICVGTTTCRALESIPEDASDGIAMDTTLLIRPGHRFRHVDVLLTNFHLPRSSLLLLVDALAPGRWRPAYAHALEHGYRFYSYGDANWIEAGE